MLETIKNIVSDIKKSMSMTDNTYTQTGYEISLDIIKTHLELNGVDTSFMNDEEGTEDDLPF